MTSLIDILVTLQDNNNGIVTKVLIRLTRIALFLLLEFSCCLKNINAAKNRPSTVANYLMVWRHFNAFLMQLDDKPQLWEDRVSLFAANLIDEGIQSSTLKSYISVIKGLLVDGGYDWDDGEMLICTLSQACRMINDRVSVRLPIKCGLLEIIPFEIKRIFHDQTYLSVLYQTIFIIAYYGLFRVGELATGTYPVRAKDVHIGQNKGKILFVLYTSKTHGLESRPQKIKIKAIPDVKSNKLFAHSNLCDNIYNFGEGIFLILMLSLFLEITLLLLLPK